MHGIGLLFSLSNKFRTVTAHRAEKKPLKDDDEIEMSKEVPEDRWTKVEDITSRDIFMIALHKRYKKLMTTIETSKEKDNFDTLQTNDGCQDSTTKFTMSRKIIPTSIIPKTSSTLARKYRLNPKKDLTSEIQVQELSAGKGLHDSIVTKFKQQL